MKRIFLLFWCVVCFAPVAWATDVSGPVSGTWTAASSPYYVNGDLTVLTGQTLVIEAGVRVLFTGHYQFIVNGALQALGTAHDSVVFTRAYPTEESKWAGIRFVNAAALCSLAYCVIEHGHARTRVGEYDPLGGGIFTFGSSPRIFRCSIRLNRAYYGGGVACDTYGPWLTECRISGNTAAQAGGGLNSWRGAPILERCTIDGNSSDYGGGVSFALSTVSIAGCTIYGNQAPNGGGIYHGEPGNVQFTMTSTIVAASSGAGIVFQVAVPAQIHHAAFYGNTGGNFANVQNGPAGLGLLITTNVNGDSCDQYHNIFLDPQFLNAPAGDYCLGAGSPCIDAGDPTFPLDPDGTRADIGACPFTQEAICAPTTLPFLDNFDSPELDSCWFWIREDTSHWSLTERPGWLRIVTQAGADGSQNCCLHNVLLRAVPATNLRLSTRVSLNSVQNFNGGGITVYVDSSYSVELLAAYLPPQGPSIMLYSHFGNTVVGHSVPYPGGDVYLRLENLGDRYSGWFSMDASTWACIGDYTNPYLGAETRRAGLVATQGWDTIPEVPVDLDYFQADPLPGTEVCGNVSGVWTAAEGPYYVTCDVTVPFGQTLTIEPGVRVAFTGNYTFTVWGDLQAIGTAEDSITFTRAYSTDASRWAGLIFLGQQFPSPTSHLAYFVIEHSAGRYMGSCYGGLSVGNCSPQFEHGTIRYNGSSSVYGPGGGIYVQNSLSQFTDCLISHNHAATGGGIAVRGNGSPVFTRCTVIDNNTEGVSCEGPAQFISCTISRNTTDVNWLGSGFSVVTGQGTPSLNNCIVWGNTGGAGQIANSPGVTFTDVQGGYPGEGNINADPLFVDAASGDFHLLVGSPCIDAGDPASPLDPDNTVADMGAFPYLGPRLRLLSPVGGEEWRVFSNDTVRWSGFGLESAVRIELNRDYPNGAWERLADSTANDGEEVVYVTDPLSDHCRVRISAVGDTLADISDGDFSITASQGYLGLMRVSAPMTPVLSWAAGVVECPQTAGAVFRLKNFGSEAIVVFQPQEPGSAEFARSTSCAGYLALAPGQMSACSLRLSFDPPADGVYRDTLLIQTDAVNAVGGFVRIPLSGEQISTPASPQVVIQIVGPDARLSWPPVTQSVGGCAVNTTGYLVFYSSLDDGSFEYHGFTSDTSYVHTRVAQFAPGMFYHVVTYTGSLARVAGLVPGMTREAVEQTMNEER